MLKFILILVTSLALFSCATYFGETVDDPRNIEYRSVYKEELTRYAVSPEREGNISACTNVCSETREFCGQKMSTTQCLSEFNSCRQLCSGSTIRRRR